MAQNLIAGLIVAAAALYLVWRYLPRRWRRRLGLAEAPGCGASACGPCGHCGTAGEVPTKPVALPAKRP